MNYRKNIPGYDEWRRVTNRKFDDIFLNILGLPGFGSAAPAQPAAAQKPRDPTVAAAAAEEIASRNQGSSRRAEFTKKNRASLLLKKKDETVKLG